MITLVNISKKYKNKTVLDNITYSFNDTGIYFITGKSGSGKTTLLNIISGNIKSSEGSIIYTNIDSIYEDSYYIYQDFNLIPTLTVLDNIKLVLKIKNKTFDDAKVKERLEDVGLIDFINSKTNQLSGGERQRLSIVIGLLLQSKVIFLDEPTSALDKDNSLNIIKLLKELSLNTLIIIATHDLSLIEERDNVINLNDFKNNDISIVQNESSNSSKKINLGFKSFYVKHEMMKKDIMRLLFQIIFITTLLISLTFVIPFSNMTYDAVSAKEIVNGSQNIIVDSMNTKSDDVQSFLFNGDNTYKMNRWVPSDFSFIYEDNSLMIRNTFIDNSLNDDEIIISNNLESELTKDSLLDKYISVGDNNLKVIKIEKCENISHTIMEYSYEYIKVNYHTYAKIDDMLTSTYIEHFYKFNLDNSLSEGTCTVSNDYYEQKLKDKNVKIGDIITLTQIESRGNYSVDVKLVGIGEKNTIDKISLYNLYDQEYQSNTYIFSELTDYNKTLKLIEFFENERINFYFNNEYATYFVSEVFNGLDILLKVLIPILIVLSIFLTIYISYNMFKSNKRSFNVLSLLGVSKRSILTICLIDHIECIIISIILSIYPIVSISNYFMNTLKSMDEYNSLSISYNIFEFKYLALSAIGIFVILVAISSIFNSIRSTKSSYINE